MSHINGRWGHCLSVVKMSDVNNSIRGNVFLNKIYPWECCVYSVLNYSVNARSNDLISHAKLTIKYHLIITISIMRNIIHK